MRRTIGKRHDVKLVVAGIMTFLMVGMPWISALAIDEFCFATNITGTPVGNHTVAKDTIGPLWHYSRDWDLKWKCTDGMTSKCHICLYTVLNKSSGDEAGPWDEVDHDTKTITQPVCPGPNVQITRRMVTTGTALIANSLYETIVFAKPDDGNCENLEASSIVLHELYETKP